MSNEQLNRKEVLRATDPRDYLRDQKFLKTAQLLDPAGDNPWHLAQEGIGQLLSENDKSVVVTGLTKEHAGDPPFGLIVVARDRMQGVDSSAYLTSLEKGEAEAVADAIRTVTIYLPDKQRLEFARRMIVLGDEFQRMEYAEVVERCVTETLNLIDDEQPEERVEDFASSFYSPDGDSSPAQREKLNRSLRIASRKVPPQTFDALVQKLREDARWNQESFGFNFPYFFTAELDFVLKHREDIQEDFDSLRPKNPPQRFPVETVMETPVDSVEALEARLRTMPAESSPDFRFRKYEPRRAEFVGLENVVGGGYGRTFLLNEGTRGPRHILKIAQALASGDMDLDNMGMPIRVDELNGKFYVNADGRHRVAALKALGVTFAPMLVTHYR